MRTTTTKEERTDLLSSLTHGRVSVQRVCDDLDEAEAEILLLRETVREARSELAELQRRRIRALLGAELARIGAERAPPRDDGDCQAGGPALTSDEMFERYGFYVVIRALPYLKGDALLHISSALPPLAKAWEVRENLRWRRNASPIGGDFARVERRFRPQTREPFWVALTWRPDNQIEYSEHDDPVEAQAACDTRLQATKVVPCGEIVVFPEGALEGQAAP